VGNKERGTLFSAGVVLGSVGGFVMGMLFGKYLVATFSMVASLLLRRDPGDRQRPKFEWLLQ
jgi:hypothetical protein